jgi:hypothetical protein
MGDPFDGVFQWPKMEFFRESACMRHRLRKLRIQQKTTKTRGVAGGSIMHRIFLESDSTPELMKHFGDE